MKKNPTIAEEMKQVFAFIDSETDFLKEERAIFKEERAILKEEIAILKDEEKQKSILRKGMEDKYSKELRENERLREQIKNLNKIIFEMENNQEKKEKLYTGLLLYNKELETKIENYFLRKKNFNDKIRTQIDPFSKSLAPNITRRLQELKIIEENFNKKNNSYYNLDEINKYMEENSSILDAVIKKYEEEDKKH